MSKAGMAVLAAWAAGVLVAVAGVAALSIPLLQGGAQSAPPDGALLMRGSQPLLPPGKLHIVGEVAALAAGDHLQSVELRVGTDVIPVGVQAQYWEATVLLTDVERMVSVETRSSKGRQASLLGSLSRLSTMAAGDGRVDVHEHSALRVSPFSTALARHVEYALGRPPATDPELDQTARAVGHDGLDALAYALGGIAAGELPLPAGYQDGYAFSADRAAFHAWQDLPPRDAWSGYVFGHEGGAPVAHLSELPARMLMLGGLSVTQYPGYTGSTRLLERMSDGSVNFHEDQPLSNPNYRISLDGLGQIILTPTTTVSRLYERTFPDVSVVRRTSQGHVLRRLARSGSTSLWILKSDWVDLDVGSAGAPPVPVTEYRVLSGTDLDGWVRASAWSFSSLQFSLPWLCIEPGTLLPERMGICGYPLHGFGANGSGYTTEQGMPLTADGEPMVPWGSTVFDVAIDNGTRLTIDNSQTQTHFWRLQSGTVGRSVVPTVFLSRSLQGTTQGETLVGLTPSFLLQFDVTQPSIIQPLGNWRTGFQQAQAPSYLGPDISVTFSRLADGTSQYSVQGDYGDSVDSLRWSMTGFGIYNVRASARYADGSSRQVNGCTPSVIAAGAISCSALVRYFRPITLARGSYYGVEERYQVRYPDPNASGQPRFAIARDYSRLGFEMCESVECIDVFPKTEPSASSISATQVVDRPSGRPGIVDRPRRFVVRVPLLSPRYEKRVERDDDCPACGDRMDGPWEVSRGADVLKDETDPAGHADHLRSHGGQDARSLLPDDAHQPDAPPRQKSWMTPLEVESKPAAPSSSSRGRAV